MKSKDKKKSMRFGEDRSAPANLPQEVIHKKYPKQATLGGYQLGDSLESIDFENADSVRKLRKQF